MYLNAAFAVWLNLEGLQPLMLEEAFFIIIILQHRAVYYTMAWPWGDMTFSTWEPEPQVAAALPKYVRH